MTGRSRSFERPAGRLTRPGKTDKQGRISISPCLQCGRKEDEDENQDVGCLLYTSDAAEDPLCVDPGGSSIIKKKHI